MYVSVSNNCQKRKESLLLDVYETLKNHRIRIIGPSDNKDKLEKIPHHIIIAIIIKIVIIVIKVTLERECRSQFKSSSRTKKI